MSVRIMKNCTGWYGVTCRKWVLTDFGYYLSGHDWASWFVFWQWQLAESTPGPGGEEPQVVGDFHDGTSEHVQRPWNCSSVRQNKPDKISKNKFTWNLDHSVVCSKCFKLVWRCLEWKTRDFGNLLSNFLSKTDPDITKVWLPTDNFLYLASSWYTHSGL